MAGEKLMAGATLGSGLIGGTLNLIAQRRANKANMEMAKYAYSKDLEQWNRANEYNDPSSQMERLKKAGLNPKSIYGSGGATTQAAQSPKYQAPDIKPLPMDFTSGFPAALSAFQDMQIKQQQLDNMRAQERATNALVKERAWKDYLTEKTFDASVKSKLAQYKYSDLRNEIAIVTKNRIQNQNTFDSLTALDRAELIKRASAIAGVKKDLLDQEYKFKGKAQPFQLSALQSKARGLALGNQKTLQDIARGELKRKFEEKTIGAEDFQQAYKDKLLNEAEIKKLEAEWFVATKIANIGSQLVGSLTDIFPATRTGKAAAEAVKKMTGNTQKGPQPKKRVASKGAKESMSDPYYKPKPADFGRHSYNDE